MKQVKGEEKGHIAIYTLSTCGWCKKTKRLLNEMGAQYEYIDVDLLEGEEKSKAIQELKRWNPQCTFPTLVINNKCIVGYDEEKIRKAVEP